MVSSIDSIAGNLPWCCLFIEKCALYLVSDTGNGSHFQHAAAESVTLQCWVCLHSRAIGLPIYLHQLSQTSRKSRVSDPIFSKSQYEIEGAKPLSPLACYGNNVYISYKEKHITEGWFLESYIVTLYFKGKSSLCTPKGIAWSVCSWNDRKECLAFSMA